jgi:hypothetical protein
LTRNTDPILVLLLGFLVTFLATRRITSRIKSGKGRFSDLSVGALHVHHMVWGVALVLLCGTLEFALAPQWPLIAFPAVLFGAGAALILDEFALILYLRDVYWCKEGRRSLDAVIVVTVVLAMLTFALRPGELPEWGAFLVGLLAVYVLLIAICLAKGKFFTTLIGAFLPYILIIGALRLARPESIWARRFYRESGKRYLRSLKRFNPERRRERGRKRLFDGMGISIEPQIGGPSPPGPG